MESQFDQIEKMASESGKPLKIGDNNSLQYIGLVADDRKLIYINAFPSSRLKDKTVTWKEKAVMVCDGGPDYWGVVYDTKTENFFDLAFNGSS